MAATTPLPGVEHMRPAVLYRLAIGGLVTRGGKTFPQRNDFFTVTVPSAEDSRRYVVQRELQEALCETVGSDKPTSVPVRLWTNNANECLYQERAHYAGSRRVCHCNRFRVKRKEEALKSGLAWPCPDLGGVGDEYYVGVAEWKVYEQDGKRYVLKSRRSTLCDPMACPIKEAGNCKPRTILVCELDLPEVVTAGALAKVTSTGIFTAMYLRSSIGIIALRTGGWLAGVPLNLLLEWTRPMDTPGGVQRLPYVRLESRLPAGQLPEEARAISQLLLGNKERLLALQAATIEAKVTAVESEPEAIQAEFYPATEHVSPDELGEPTEAEFRAALREMGEQLGLSAAQIDRDLAECHGPDDYPDLQNGYMARLRERDNQPTRLFPGEEGHDA